MICFAWREHFMAHLQTSGSGVYIGNTDWTIRVETKATDAAVTELQTSKIFFWSHYLPKKKKSAIDEADIPTEKTHFSTCLRKHKNLLKWVWRFFPLFSLQVCQSNVSGMQRTAFCQVISWDNETRKEKKSLGSKDLKYRAWLCSTWIL